MMEVARLPLREDMAEPVFEEISIPLRHCKVAGRAYGPRDGMPVLALHGWLDNSMSFSRIVPLLSGMRVVMPDMPGHGLSEYCRSGGFYPISDYAANAMAIADQLGWERFSLIGHSLGGIVAVLLGASVPERIERLSIIDAVVAHVTCEAEQAPGQLGKALRANRNIDAKAKPVYRTRQEAVEARMHGSIPVSEEASTLLAQRGLMAIPQGYTWSTDVRLTLPTPLPMTKDYADGFIRALEQPTQILLAEQGLLQVRPEYREFLGGLRHSLEVLPGGHHLHLDSAEGAAAVAAAIESFFHSSK